MDAPFALPVSIEDDYFLVANDSELISYIPDATEEELQYIVWAINQQFKGA